MRTNVLPGNKELMHLLLFYLFFFLYNVDEAIIIKFTMAIAEKEKSVEFLDFRIKCAEGALSVYAFTKLTNSFTYVKHLHVIHLRT